MRTAAPPLLLPIFRSSSQAELLAETFLHPDREYSVAELARRRTIPLSTVHREVGQLLGAGLLAERRIGHVRQVSANSDSPFFEPMRTLIERAFGPQARVQEALRPLGDVRGAWLFGSSARRLSGVQGEPPHDVDVAVVVDDAALEGGTEDIYQACARVGALLGLEVNATVFNVAEWDDLRDIFVRQIRAGVLIDLLAGGGHEGPIEPDR